MEAAIETAGARRNPLKLAWGALFFNDEVYAEVRDEANPVMRGFLLVLVIAIIAGVAGAIGMSLDWLTSPNMNSIRTVVREALTEMPWFREAVREPGFREGFMRGYKLWWQVMPGLLGFPTLSGALRSLILSPIGMLLGWLIGGSLTALAARLLGGQGGFGQTLGVLGLAAAPRLLHVIAIWPGLEIGGLVGWWSLAIAYWAVRSVHHLGWPRTLAAVLVPRVLLVLLLFVLAALAGAVAGFVSGG